MNDITQLTDPYIKVVIVEQTIKVVIVDDHPLMIAGIRYAINSQPDMKVIAEAGDGKEAMEIVKKYTPDIILMDVLLPTTNGIEVSIDIKMLYPAIKIIIISGAADATFILQSIKAGFNGYLLKGCNNAELFFAIREVMRGNMFLSPYILTMSDYVKSIQSGSISSDILSDIEREILRLFAEGRSNDICKRFDITINTVEIYINRLMIKLRCKSFEELIRYAIQNQIV